MTVQKSSSSNTVADQLSGNPNPPPAPATQSQPNPPPKKGKDKKIFSCHSCRRRKLKCDRFDPCGACEARGEGNSCTWEEGQRPERNHRESLEQLPKLILKLTEEIQQLKTSNSALIENIKSRGKELAGGLDLTPLDSRPQSHDGSDNNSAHYIGWDFLCQIPDRKQWTPSRLIALLPESQLLWGLISHYISTSASLTGFIDVQRLIGDVEEVQQLRQGLDLASSSTTVGQLDIKISMILACASLAVVDLTPMQAQELGLANTDMDALVRDLWKRSRTLIASSDLDPFPPVTKCILPDGRSQAPDTNSGLLQQNGIPTAAAADNNPLQVVAIKLLLLLAARSFAAPSEYLKLHLDVISSAIDASLDSSCDDGIPLMDREWRWQLWSFICLLDWTSPGIYHNSSYFMRPEMHRNPPSKVPGIPDDGTAPSAIEPERRDRLGQTRHYLEYALALAHLSRRAEDCIILPGPVSPAQAAELCTELDALDNKLSFYQLLGGSILPDGSAFNPGAMPGDRTTSGTGDHLAAHKYKYNSTEHRLLSLARAPLIQNMHLSLELGLIRFKLFRHEAFHLMHAPSTSGALRMMCLDACMDACILVLAQCWSIGNRDVPGVVEAQAQQSQMYLNPPSESKSPCTGTLRRVLQPASSAALVGQVLLHAAQGTEVMAGTGHGTGKGKQFQSDLAGESRGNSATAEFFAFLEGGGGEFASSASGATAISAAQGPYTAATAGGGGGGSWSGRMSREKVKVLQWHINKVLTLLEALQGTSSLARYKLSLYQQCM
ncbi:Zn(II)2Cys6 transcription factor domain-containing protein [Aspergillus saccharolyticus JOP 1030-1]|uniref:Putative C6 finger domain protein n=1 Tax=Aspergillus saccharolyticus JOP 1030-1 TaxID=1450539 RepID=A0A318Z712_9EURO|nr:putative C6 finger domain protein [Aspergillus saccharolyticus JOP 1030-1]PYH43125.1 putative C6 finger domain protein [Aspergillus saccharolyticus JOP 1030-1]